MSICDKCGDLTPGLDRLCVACDVTDNVCDHGFGPDDECDACDAPHPDAFRAWERGFGYTPTPRSET